VTVAVEGDATRLAEAKRCACWMGIWATGSRVPPGDCTVRATVVRGARICWPMDWMVVVPPETAVDATVAVVAAEATDCCVMLTTTGVRLPACEATAAAGGGVAGEERGDLVDAADIVGEAAAEAAKVVAAWAEAAFA